MIVCYLRMALFAPVPLLRCLYVMCRFVFSLLAFRHFLDGPFGFVFHRVPYRHHASLLYQ